MEMEIHGYPLRSRLRMKIAGDAIAVTRPGMCRQILVIGPGEAWKREFSRHPAAE
jgi:hypothetical protein